MSNEMIDGLKRAYMQAMVEARRYNRAADGIAEVIRAAEMGTQDEAPTAEPMAMDPLGLKAAKTGASARLAEARRVMKLDQLASGAAPKISRKAAKIAKAKPAAPEAKAGGMKSRVCVICNKMFLPKAGVQKACSPTCVAEKNRRYALEKYHAKQAAKKKGGAKPAPINLDKPSPAGQPTRLERIRAAAERMDGIPESVRAAVAEARESEVM